MKRAFLFKHTNKYEQTRASSIRPLKINFVRMKSKIILTCVLVVSLSGLQAQDKANSSIPLIGSEAPVFTAESTKGLITFPGDYISKWKILFSHPRDFTAVCSSEILELAQKQDDFEKLNVKLFVLSTDTLSQHITWVNTLDTLTYKGRVPVAVKFPLIDDNNKSISKMYGMLHPLTSSSRDVRGVFIVDPKNKIRAIFFYPIEVGRNLDEIERTVIALQTSDRQNVLTPANWKPGEDVFLPYIDKKATADKGVYYISPFMIAKKAN